MVDFKDIEAAAKRLAPVTVETPLLRSSALDEIAGGTVYIKPENLQVTGSFKFRGAYNMLSQLTADEAKHGVVAFSSGNHAQAVAASGTMLGIDTTIVMPEDAPAIKIENTRRLGGKAVLYDRYSEDREAIAREIAAETGSVVVPAFDHERIIAGQGTVGLELMRQCADFGVTPDQVLVSCSGGGLISGTALAVKTMSPETSVYPVEPEDFDDTARSLISGERETNDPGARSICDALQTERPGKLTFAINRKLLGAGLVVSDGEVKEAMRFAFRHLKLVVEPGGAVALAAVLSGKIDTRDKLTVIVLSGGNVDAEMFAAIQKEQS
ncbi:MAG: threonine/serine dehydratase [Proteobacteria bacterium]|nr:threonine/serine dehydratase [Pseudomonadota bacterium]